jgi:lysylphosphatidylglycerol synthetase-like protein (DUF2156 family)
MTNKELKDALLRLDATQLRGSTDAGELAWRVLDSDRRAIRRWTFATIALWIVAAIIVVLAIFLFGFFMPAHAKAMLESGVQFPIAGEKPTPEQMHLILTAFLGKLGFLVTLGVAALGLATIASVCLIIAGRRATLRQVNASLLEISDQLKRLTMRPAKPAENG